MIALSFGGAIARSAAEVGAIVGATALVAFTMSGETARRLAMYRSPIPLLAFTPQPATRSQLALSWGVETFIVRRLGTPTRWSGKPGKGAGRLQHDRVKVSSPRADWREHVTDELSATRPLVGSKEFTFVNVYSMEVMC
jgi:Pyruvate kinase, alpha/beta domain